MVSSVGNSIENAPSSNEKRENEELMIHKERMVQSWLVLVEESGKERRWLEENMKPARTIQELQHKLDEITEG